VDANMLGRALFYGAGAGKLPTASAVVADIIDILSHKAEERILPKWKIAEPSDVADPALYACRRCYVIEGCPKCAEKAMRAFDTEDCRFIADRKFAIVTPGMTEKASAAALASTGLVAKLCLPILD
jgi:homoserine dehydrogenase